MSHFGSFFFNNIFSISRPSNLSSSSVLASTFFKRDRYQNLHDFWGLFFKEGCISCSWRAFPAGTLHTRSGKKK